MHISRIRSLTVSASILPKVKGPQIGELGITPARQNLFHGTCNNNNDREVNMTETLNSRFIQILWEEFSMRHFTNWCMGLALLGAVGCQSTTGKTAGQTMTDSGITASVQAKLTADNVSNFSRIDVDTERGIVSLNGVVQNAQQRDRAEQLTRQVGGVRGLNNNLQIQAQSPKVMD